MPIPVTATVEEITRIPGTGDRHVSFRQFECFLYELFSSYVSGKFVGTPDSAAVLGPAFE